MTEEVSSSNPEREAIVYNLLEKLAVEAKFVLYMVLNSPGELVELSTILFGKKSKEMNKFQLYKTTDPDNKAKLDKRYLKRYLKRISKTTKNESIVICNHCGRILEDDYYYDMNRKCYYCGKGNPEVVMAGWRTVDINKTIFNVREFLRELEKV